MKSFSFPYPVSALILALMLAACGSQPPAPVVDEAARSAASEPDSKAPAKPKTRPASRAKPGSATPRPAQSKPAKSKPGKPATPRPARRPNAAVQALLKDADAHERSGRYTLAVAAVERALRLAPRDARLWSRLAGIRAAQRQWSQAEQLAGKSNSLAGSGEKRLMAANWRLIAQARERLGDARGALQARNRAAELD